MITYYSSLKRFGLFALSLLAVSVLFLLLPADVNANPSVWSPDPTSSSGSPVGHIVSKADYNTVNSTDLVIYSPIDSIGVAIVSADVCRNNEKLNGIEDIRNGGINQNMSNGDPISTFKLKDPKNGNGIDTQIGRINDNCNPGSNPKTAMNFGDTVGSEGVANSTRMLRVTSIGKSQPIPLTDAGGAFTAYQFKLHVTWDGAGQCGDPNGSCGVNAFKVKALPISGGKYVDPGSRFWISQDDTFGAKNFGLVGNPNAFYDYSVEFGSDCSLDPGDTSTERLQIYDDDNFNAPAAQNTSQYFRVRLEKQDKNGGSWQDVNLDISTNENPPGPKLGGLSNYNFNGTWYTVGTDSHKPLAPFNINLGFTAQGNFRYKFSVQDIDGNNKLQFAYPFQTVFADAGCAGIQTDETVYINPFVSGVVDPSGTSATFTQGATVANYPRKTTQWGYNELASQNAKDDNVYANQRDYDAVSNKIRNGTAERECANGSWDTTASNCGGNATNKNKFKCKNPPDGATCASYHYRCHDSGSLPNADRGWSGTNNAPNCAVDELKCNINTGNSTATLQNNGDIVWGGSVSASNYCHNKWACKNNKPDGTPYNNGGDPYQIWQSATTNPNYLCRYYSCQNTHDPQNFYEALGNGKQPRDRCDYRCNNGKGTDDSKPDYGYGHAPLAKNDDGHWGAGDQKCYIPPTFYIRCTWDAGGGSTNYETVTKDNYGGVFCQGDPNTTTNRNTINASGQICATTTPEGNPAPPGDFNWLSDDVNYLPPGKGDVVKGVGNFSTYRTVWHFAINPADPACVSVGAKPYFSVLGGDIAAGPGFNTGGSCTSVPGSSIIGSGYAAGPYNGAGAQLAALALGQIKAFATSKTQVGGLGHTWIDSLNANTPPDGTASELAFSNDPSTLSTSVYGGQFGKNNWCVPDYYANVDHTAPTVVTPPAPGGNLDVSSLANTSTTYYYNGDLTLKTGIIPANGQKIILKVNGNVYITGPNNSGITYVNDFVLAHIPQFQVLAAGNITVDPSVIRLDGFYDAQGSSGAGGLFATCARNSGPITGPSAKAQCDKKLTVNGSVAAGIIMLNRTVGDRSANFGELETPAETFIYSPQLWLPSASGGTIGPWQSVTSLPPIL